MSHLYTSCARWITNWTLIAQTDIVFFFRKTNRGREREGERESERARVIHRCWVLQNLAGILVTKFYIRCLWVYHECSQMIIKMCFFVWFVNRLRYDTILVLRHFCCCSIFSCSTMETEFWQKTIDKKTNWTWKHLVRLHNYKQYNSIGTFL